MAALFFHPRKMPSASPKLGNPEKQPFRSPATPVEQVKAIEEAKAVDETRETFAEAFELFRRWWGPEEEEIETGKMPPYLRSVE